MTRLSAIAKRVERATEGPWFVAEQPFDDRSTAVYGDNKARISCDPHGARLVVDCDVTMEWTEGEPDQSVFDRANARFIAHAREDVPYLLALVESYAKEVAALRKAIKDVGTDGITITPVLADAIAAEREKLG